MLALAVGARVALRPPALADALPGVPGAAWRLAYLPPGLRCDGRRGEDFLFTAAFPAQGAVELLASSAPACAAAPYRVHYRVC